MLLKLYEKNNSAADLQQVIDILNNGGIIIYPTDTMYAIGCHGLKERAIERIFNYCFITRFVHCLQISLELRVGNLFAPEVIQRAAIHEVLPY